MSKINSNSKKFIIFEAKRQRKIQILLLLVFSIILHCKDERTEKTNLKQKKYRSDLPKSEICNIGDVKYII